MIGAPLVFEPLLCLLTSTFGVGAFLPQRRCILRSSCLFVRWRRLHVGLPPVPVSAEAVATLESILAVAAAAMPMFWASQTANAMFFDLSFCQQPCGLPSPRASLMLVVLPIELPKTTYSTCLQA